MIIKILKKQANKPNPVPLKKVLIIYLVLKLLLESICLPFRIERVALEL